MAEGILQKALISAGKTECSVSSAGLGALAGHEADPTARQLMTDRGLDISSHRARQLTDDMLHQADLILVMEAWQKAVIETRTPSAKGKVFRFGEWEGIDISDPYQKDRSEFIRSVTLIEQSAAQWITRL
ncbi:MAG: low molecular weight phosphotyrosine protein phosphatase [Nitrosomonas sp.]|nr:low molecular weight phosphotyrosine protein phosphatase [Nitrosomonas sp.]